MSAPSLSVRLTRSGRSTGISSDFVAIVASPEVEGALAGLHKKTHTITVRGRNSVNGSASIALDLLGHETFREALRDTGLDDARIERLARESARSPTVLRRRLAQAEEVKSPYWAKDNTVARSMIPFMFVGAWDSSVKADRKILRRLTNGHDDDVERTFAQLRTLDEPPVWSIGHLRGVASKIDALQAVNRVLTKRDLENFLDAAKFVLSKEDPALELPEDKRWAADLYGKSRDHSSALRDGLCDTLVLLAVHGSALVRDHLGIDLESEVDAVIRCLLSPSAASPWLSQKNHLPQYAEAAPEAFLSIVEADLNGEEPRLAELFAPAVTGLLGDCPRSGMLWALELLAWKPEQLVRVTSILAKMCAWEIDDNFANKPMATLKSIFRFWMPQTAASLDQRNRALYRLTREFPEFGWQICVDQFIPEPIVGSASFRPRWRSDAHDAGEGITIDEARAGQLHAIKLALDWPTHDEHTLGDLVWRLERLGPDHRERVWELIRGWNESGPTEKQKAELRQLIRSSVLTGRGPNAVLDAEERKRALQACGLLESDDPVMRHQWLFLNRWVDACADELKDRELDYDRREERIARQRYEALQEVWAEKGLDGIMELCRSGNASSVVGRHMAEICTEVQEAANFVQDVFGRKSDEQRGKRDQCISGFLARLEMRERDAVLAELIGRFGFDEDGNVSLLCCAPFDADTWKHLDRLSESLQRRYWKEVVPPYWSRHDETESATVVDELLKVDRPRAAFHAVHKNLRDVDSPRLIRLLAEVATNGAEPPTHYRPDAYSVSDALETLERRGDATRDDLARLEFLFINALEHSEHGLPNLEAQLAETPALFMHALALCVRRKDGGEDPAEWQGTNPDNREAVANAAYSLLTRASRIPGTQPDGSIDPNELRDWLKQVRALAREHGRAEIGDQMIGQLLSHCPSGDDGIWPCEPVREVIDGLGSHDIEIGMLIGVRNEREATLLVAGAARESGLAEMYRSWSQEVAFEYPFVARMLEQIGASYDRDAQWLDNFERVGDRIDH